MIGVSKLVLDAPGHHVEIDASREQASSFIRRVLVNGTYPDAYGQISLKS